MQESLKENPLYLLYLFYFFRKGKRLLQIKVNFFGRIFKKFIVTKEAMITFSFFFWLYIF